jgi:hypothetical protein
LYTCDATSFSSETQNKNNQGKLRGLFIGGHELSAHRYRKAKIDCLSFVMCPLQAQLILAFFFLFFFLLRPFTVQFQQTRQAVRAIKQSIYS